MVSTSISALLICITTTCSPRAYRRETCLRTRSRPRSGTRFRPQRELDASSFGIGFGIGIGLVECVATIGLPHTVDDHVILLLNQWQTTSPQVLVDVLDHRALLIAGKAMH